MVFDIIFILLLVIWVYLRSKKSKSILFKWAEQNKLEIISYKYVFFFRGPFVFPNTGVSSVYDICVRDENRNEKFGWVKIGSDFSGLLFCNEIEKAQSDSIFQTNEEKAAANYK